MAYVPSDSAPLVPGALTKGRGLPDNLVRNGRALSAETVRRVADQLNFLLGCGQVIGWRVFDGDGYPAALTAGTGLSAPSVCTFYCKNSKAGDGITYNLSTFTLVALAFPENDGAGPPSIRVDSYTGLSGGSYLGSSSTVRLSGGPVSATVPNDVGVALVTFRVLTSDAYFRHCVVTDTKRCWLSFVLFEHRAKQAIPSIGPEIVDTGIINAKAHITEETQEQIYKSAEALWQYTKVLVHQSFWYGNASPSQSTNSASYLNIIDKTSTTVTSTTPGWSVDVSYSDRLSSSAVSATFCVRAYVTAGTGTVILLDQAGTTLGTISVTATSATDHTTTVTLTGGTGTTTSKVDVHFKCSGGTIHVTDFALLMTN